MNLYRVKKVGIIYKTVEICAIVVLYYAFDLGVEGSSPFYDDDKTDLGFKSYFENCLIDPKLVQEAIGAWMQPLFTCRAEADFVALHYKKEDREREIDLGELIAWDTQMRINDFKNHQVH